MLWNVWRIHLLGSFSVGQGAVVRNRFSTRQNEILLAMLADQVGVPLDRSSLIENLWPADDVDLCRNRLRVALAYLRRAIEPADVPPESVLKADRARIELSAESAEVDAVRFRSLCEQANRSQVREERIEKYSAADRLYRGQFLAGWSGDWVDSRRLFYARLQGTSQKAHSALLEEAGEIEGALAQIRRAIDAEPLREAFRRRELRLLAELGEPNTARESFDQYRTLLKREVGLAPSDTLQDWVHGLPVSRKGSPPASKHEENLVKEVEAPLRSFNNVYLPPETSAFFGRATEVADVSELLLSVRFVNLVGPGGIGKTRLACRIASASADNFRAGMFLVPAGDGMSPSTSLHSVLQQLGIESAGDPLTALKRHINRQGTASGRNGCLLVLDDIRNSDGTEELISRLLAEIPNLTVLATSRSHIDQPGGIAYNVGPLARPEANSSLEASFSNPSVQLFVDRAKVADPRFALTKTNARPLMELCRELGGIPLAIELAAARSKGVSSDRLLAELGLNAMLSKPNLASRKKVDPLHSSLVGSMALLDKADQATFRALCVFKGTFDLSAAAYVAGADYDALQRFADHSLLNREVKEGEPRFSMLEMVREFGWRQSSIEQQEEMRERHATFYRRQMADSELLMQNGTMRQCIRIFHDSHNISAALNHTLATADSETISWLLVRLAWIWAFGGALQEGMEIVRNVHATRSFDKTSEARVQMAEGILACYQDDAEEAASKLGACMPVLARTEETAHYPLMGQCMLALSSYMAGKFQEALDLATAVRPELSRRGFLRWYATADHVVGASLNELGDRAGAREALAESQRTWKEVGDEQFTGYSSLGFARISCSEGSFGDAQRFYLQAIRAFGDSADLRGVGYAFEGLGRVAVTLKHFPEGARLLGAAQRLRDDTGVRRDFADERDFNLAMGSLKSAMPGWQAAFRAGALLSRNELTELATSITGSHLMAG